MGLDPRYHLSSIPHLQALSKLPAKIRAALAVVRGTFIVWVFKMDYSEGFQIESMQILQQK